MKRAMVNFSHISGLLLSSSMWQLKKQIKKNKLKIERGFTRFKRIKTDPEYSG